MFARSLYFYKVYRHSALLRVSSAFRDFAITPHVSKVKPNKWDYLKTEGIDFLDDFLWFDDNFFPEERDVLEKNKTLNNFRLIELHKYPNQLKQEII